MKTIITVLMVLLLMVLGFGDKKEIPLEDLFKPAEIAIGKNNFYVTDGTNVLIYSLKDFKLIKKFGKAGTGPGEFQMGQNGRAATRISEWGDQLIVNSPNKVSFFTKAGEFVKEKKVGNPNPNFIPIPSGYLGIGNAVSKDGIRYVTIDLFNSEFESIKQFSRFELFKNGKINLLNIIRAAGFAYFGKQLYVVDDKGFSIKILDLKGNKIGNIKEKYDRVVFTEKDKKNFLEAIKANLPNKAMFERLKNMFGFSKYYPEIMFCQMSNNILNVYTWKKKDGKNEIFFYDSKGKFLKKSYVDIKIQAGMGIQPYPMAVHDWKLYQLIDDDEEEIWKLHITDIK